MTRKTGYVSEMSILSFKSGAASAYLQIYMRRYLLRIAIGFIFVAFVCWRLRAILSSIAPH
jgi:hypothetical protein